MNIGKILITNIGNRNFKYLGRTFDVINKDKRITKGRDFVAFTEHLHSNYSRCRNKISLNILNTVLDSKDYEISTIILYASKQNPVHHQDTFYEGEILKKKIEAEYKVPVILEVIEHGITDNDALMKYFRKQLKELNSKFPDQTFLICDAGGTPQQKTALKIIAEYILPLDKFEVIYLPDSKPPKIIHTQQVEYRRVLAEVQMLKLCRQGDYQGAKLLLNDLYISEDDRIIKWLDLAFLLKKNLFEHPNLNRLRKDPLISKNIRSKEPSGCYSKFSNDFEKNHFYEICHCFENAEFELSVEHYDTFVLMFSVFYEKLFRACISKKSNFNIYSSSKYNLNRTAVENYLNEQYSTWKNSYFRNSEKLKLGVPTMILFCKELANEGSDLCKIILVIKKINASMRKDGIGIDVLRNHFAHNGKGVHKEDISKVWPDFEKDLKDIRSLLGIQSENKFVMLNNELSHILR